MGARIGFKRSVQFSLLAAAGRPATNLTELAATSLRPPPTLKLEPPLRPHFDRGEHRGAAKRHA